MLNDTQHPGSDFYFSLLCASQFYPCIILSLYKKQNKTKTKNKKQKNKNKNKNKNKTKTKTNKKA